MMRGFLGNIRNRLSRGEQEKQAKALDDQAQHEELLWQSFLKTGLLALEWYKENNRDVVDAGADPVAHFRAYGWREGRWPNPFFDPTWYLQRNTDVVEAGMNPVLHYWLYGENEDRAPHPLFDPRWYRQTYGVEIGANNNALAHYLQNRSLRIYSPNSMFDIKYYLETQPDVAAADVDPFAHFVTTGFREGRNPHPSFNVQYYLQQYMVGDSRDPLTHYFEVGRAAGHPTTPSGETGTQASEIRRFTSRSSDFEEVNLDIVGDLPRRAKVLAYYLPQFHPFPENDEWWGKGFTEWTNVGRGTPRFVGHYQPRIPRDFGFYDLRDPSVLPRQVSAARAAGLFGFCFYYYNFNGKRLLDAPLEDFLARREIDFPFCLMWANENWTRRWDGADAEILMRQDYRDADVESLIDDLARHFKDPRYIRVEGRPLLFLYRADVIPKTRQALAKWREIFARRHNEDPWIFMAQAFGNNDPTVFGFDGAIEFPPHKIVVGANVVNSECRVFDSSFAARVYRYKDVIEAAMGEPPPTFPLIKTVFPSWDNDARRQGQGLTVTDSTPRLYSEWLDRAIRFATAYPFRNERFVCINAWNEWTEGAYLEPDVHFGGAYLNATARAISGVGLAADHRKLVLTGHNAFPAGAQMLLLNIARTLKEQFGFEIAFLLCGDGQLLEQFREVAATLVATDTASLENASRNFVKRGYEGAIVNSVGSGSAAAYLKSGGLKVVSLVHEMPKLMSENHLEPYAKALAQHSDEVVFPSPIVRDAFLEHIGPVAGTVSIRPQGIYHQAPRIDGARTRIREELGLPADARIVLNVGYGDLRKGIDLFCAAARIVAESLPNVYFVWAGEIHLHLRNWIDDRPGSPNVRFLGHRTDVAALMSAADVFALTSREDPFPSVVLEAQSQGLPIVCFADAGGAADLVHDNRFGELAAYGDTKAFAEAIVRWLQRDQHEVGRDGKRVAQDIKQRFAFDEYAFDIAQRVIPELKRISVIVPNFNYARYLPDRLNSIFAQTYPVFEVIVLDDCSSDESLAVVEQLAQSSHRRIKIIRNETNSGSPFAQWKKGLLAARGDLLWIAEADDVADPNFLGTLASAFRDPCIALAASDSRPIDSDGDALDISYKAYYSRIFAGALSEDITTDLRTFAERYLSQRNALLNVSALLWRRDVLLRAMETTEATLPTFKLAGDWLLYLTACSGEGKAAYSASELNLHRRHDKGVTHGTSGASQLEEISRIHAYFVDTFGASDDILKSQRDYLEEIREQFIIATEPQHEEASP